jgi:hypothetical protein
MWRRDWGHWSDCWVVRRRLPGDQARPDGDLTWLMAARDCRPAIGSPPRRAEPVAAETTGAALLPGCRTGGAPLITAGRGPCRAYRFRGFGDSK